MTAHVYCLFIRLLFFRTRLESLLFHESEFKGSIGHSVQNDEFYTPSVPRTVHGGKENRSIGSYDAPQFRSTRDDQSAASCENSGRTDSYEAPNYGTNGRDSHFGDSFDGPRFRDNEYGNETFDDESGSYNAPQFRKDNMPNTVSSSIMVEDEPVATGSIIFSKSSSGKLIRILFLKV
jgi:hypothetical protein